MKMQDALASAYDAYRNEHPLHDAPTSVRLNPDDYDRLRYECNPNTSWLAVDAKTAKFMGMVILLDRKWPKGFPLAMNTKGAAEAIRAGAFQA